MICKSKNRWVYLIVGILAMLLAGVLYTWSILKTPLAGEFGWSNSQLSLNYTITICMFCLGGLFAGRLHRRRQPYVSLFIGASLALAGYLLASFMQPGGALQLYLSYGCLCGLGVGFAYNAVISGVSGWFPDRPGLCSGLLVMAFGFSTLLLGNLASNLFVQVGWRAVYRLLGVLIAAVLFAAALILHTPKADDVPAAVKKGSTARDYSSGEMLRAGSFWLFMFFAVVVSSAGSTVINSARDLAVGFGAAESLAVTLTGMLSVCNGLSRVSLGAVSDRYGRNRAIIIACAVTIAAMGVLLAAYLLKNLMLCALGLCLSGLAYGSSPTLSAIFARELYGSRNFPNNYSIVNLALIPASFAPSLAAASGNYALSFAVLLALAIMALFTSKMLKKYGI